jgi:hypothetical protein
MTRFRLAHFARRAVLGIPRPRGRGPPEYDTLKGKPAITSGSFAPFRGWRVPVLFPALTRRATFRRPRGARHQENLRKPRGKRDAVIPDWCLGALAAEVLA